MSWTKRDLLGAYTSLQRTYGDCVSFQTGPYRLFIFFHPDQVHELLVTHAKSVVRLPRVMQTFSQWNGRSILIVEGEDWIRQRRLVQTGFQPRRLEHYGRVMTESARRLVESWVQLADRTGFVDVNLRTAMTALTLEIIGKTMFDVDLTADTGEIAQAVSVLSEVAFHEMQAPLRLPNWWPTEFYRRKRWAMKTLDDVVWRIVRQRREEGTDRGDLLSMLLTAVDDEGDGGRLDDRQVRDEAMTLLLAGHDTTAAGLEWICYLLARHPQVAEHCREEIRQTAEDAGAVTGDLSRLAYLQATIKESLRLYPPAFGIFLRQATKDLRLGGFDVPARSLIMLSSYVTQRDERWFPDPEKFRPERFLAPEAARIPTGAYFPFGAGPRVCIGLAFALTEMTLVTAALLERGVFSMPPGASDPIPKVLASLRPKDPLILRWTRQSVVVTAVTQTGSRAGDSLR